MSVTVQEVHALLTNLAQQHAAPITYGTLAHQFGMVIRDEVDVAFWSRLLGEISTHEHSLGKPLLSAMVISEDQNRPGNGFYELAYQLGKYAGGSSDLDRLKFYAGELNAIYKCWSVVG